jgi:hypothetical protein
VIETRKELLDLVRSYGKDGCPFSALIAEGVQMPEAAAIELRRRGYAVEISGTGGGQTYVDHL